jgi:hypothetical protein
MKQTSMHHRAHAVSLSSRANTIRLGTADRGEQCLLSIEPKLGEGKAERELQLLLLLLFYEFETNFRVVGDVLALYEVTNHSKCDHLNLEIS